MPRPIDSRRPRRGKRVVFRFATILLGLGLLPACEGVLRVGGWGRNLPSGDPYVEFDPSHPLFVLNPEENRYHTAPNRELYFAPQSFAAAKATNEFRIFVLGGSTVQGRPFSVETAFPNWLQLGLQAADDQTQWTVVNCGGISYASYRLLPILREVLQYQPDLVMVYTGHNEFLEEQLVRAVGDTPRWRRRTQAWLGRWYTYRILAAWAEFGSTAEFESGPTTARMTPEVDALLNYEDGLATYQRDDAVRQQTLQQFERNLERIARICRDAEVPMLLMNPVSNLKDSPPFKIANDEALSPSEQEAFDAAWDEARAPGLSPARRREALERALAIDDRHAGAHYLLGMSWYEQARYPAALAALTRAKEEDLCPLRMLEPMHESVRATAQGLRFPVVDVRALFVDRSIGGIPDSSLLVDHVHPTFQGHLAIADAVLHTLADTGTVTLSPGWEERRDDLVEQQFASLDNAYHARGQRQLRYLRLWTQGRGVGVREEKPE